MEKYKRADDARIKELTLHIEKLTKRVNRKKVELENEVTETQAAQIQLDKTAEDFRKLHECVPCPPPPPAAVLQLVLSCDEPCNSRSA
jgi:hypothetical protein